jgi:protein involved in plasmid replication-relaxation
VSSERGLPAATVEIVASVAVHRTLTTAQLQAIHLPGRSRRWAQRVLKRIARGGLLSYVGMPSFPGWLWFVTEAGAQLAQDTARIDAPKVLTAEQAAGQLHAHTLAVSDAGICWLSAARDRGDEFGALSWRHEVSHPLSLGRGRRRQRLVTDAVLSYVLVDGDDLSVAPRFIELDRATLGVDRLAAELARYADLYRAEGEGGEPIWSGLYPVFPPVHCILAGAPRPILERRRLATLALLRNDPRLSRIAEVGVSIALLEDLQSRGPFAAIFEDLRRPGEPVDWLGGTP